MKRTDKIQKNIKIAIFKQKKRKQRWQMIDGKRKNDGGKVAK